MYFIGKIDKDGYLLLARRGTLKIQKCPFSSFGYKTAGVHRDQLKCGDHCPLFGPFVGKGGSGDLHLCHGKILNFKVFAQVEEV